jgi:hypothetical protein
MDVWYIFVVFILYLFCIPIPYYFRIFSYSDFFANGCRCLGHGTTQSSQPPHRWPAGVREPQLCLGLERQAPTGEGCHHEPCAEAGVRWLRRLCRAVPQTAASIRKKIRIRKNTKIIWNGNTKQIQNKYNKNIPDIHTKTHARPLQP